METFIYQDLKKCSLKKDESRIHSLGPYAAALSYIIGNANRGRMKRNPDFRSKYSNFVVYRGIRIRKECFDS